MDHYGIDPYGPEIKESIQTLQNEGVLYDVRMVLEVWRGKRRAVLAQASQESDAGAVYDTPTPD